MAEDAKEDKEKKFDSLLKELDKLNMQVADITGKSNAAEQMKKKFPSNLNCARRAYLIKTHYGRLHEEKSIFG